MALCGSDSGSSCCVFMSYFPIVCTFKSKHTTTAILLSFKGVTMTTRKMMEAMTVMMKRMMVMVKKVEEIRT
jgi:hypothetical protein